MIADNGAAGCSFKFGNDAGTVKAWLHGCDGRASKWGVFVYGTAVVKVRGARADRISGAVATY